MEIPINKNLKPSAPEKVKKFGLGVLRGFNRQGEPDLPPAGMDDSLGGNQVNSGEFQIGGVNDTEVIHKLKSINGVSTYSLNQDMRRDGFIGQNENVLDVMARDNDFVLERGMTHQELASPLLDVKEYVEQGIGRQGDLSTDYEFTIEGHPYRVTSTSWRGSKESPFRDGTKTASDLEVLNLETGHMLATSGLVPEMIDQYGFYEGDVPHRVTPEAIINTFSHLRSKVEDDTQDDPIKALTSGQVSTAALNHLDQVKRYRNLYEAQVPLITEANVVIRFSSIDDILAFLRDTSNAMLFEKIDTDALSHIAAEPRQLSSWNLQHVKFSLERLSQEARQKVENLLLNVTEAQLKPIKLSRGGGGWDDFDDLLD